ncbi:TIR domain-containing protein [Mesorhizobium sp. GbtcB19]|uniref:TIR domain-containing protein n=1 Tax=Mesorhizobium sp. GbtcB19 TaxID=2824764 RepID=UPI001C308D54|nr:TIR domain-containing protein [Mesorhizobium sp. GbtcB19]
MAETDIAPDLKPARKLYQERISQLENCHSKSWFGDHSSTYYQGFRSPPSGRSFDVEWGFVPGFNGSHNPGWRIFTREEIREFVFAGVGEEVFHAFYALSDRLHTDFANLHDQVLDALEAAERQFKDASLSRYLTRVREKITPYGFGDFVNARLRSVPRMTRDSEEISKGQTVPAHVQYQAAITSVEINKRRLSDLTTCIRNAIEVLVLMEPKQQSTSNSNRIFIGHGRSAQWRILKDFVRDRLGLPYDEFNRIPTAGVGTQERLSEMLQECGFAFLLLTGEDLHDDKSLHARENVVHEAGLFQGKLGWRKAIILLEEGCEEFSNIIGLGQIRFPTGNIGAIFEDVRAVLEREGLITEQVTGRKVYSDD